MKNILCLIGLTLFLLGCDDIKERNIKNLQNNLIKTEPDEYGVVCYSSYSETLSCVKIK